jgi:hypothetical protein
LSLSLNGPIPRATDYVDVTSGWFHRNATSLHQESHESYSRITRIWIEGNARDWNVSVS